MKLRENVGERIMLDDMINMGAFFLATPLKEFKNLKPDARGILTFSLSQLGQTLPENTTVLASQNAVKFLRKPAIAYITSVSDEFV